jgi:hypothetical protein
LQRIGEEYNIYVITSPERIGYQKLKLLLPLSRRIRVAGGECLRAKMRCSGQEEKDGVLAKRRYDPSLIFGFGLSLAEESRR